MSPRIWPHLGHEKTALAIWRTAQLPGKRIGDTQRFPWRPRVHSNKLSALSRRISVIPRALLLAAIAAPFAALGAQSQRPMTFLDVQNMRQANGQDLSPD